MDARAVLTRIVADVARDLLGDDDLPPEHSDEALVGAFHAAVGEMDPVQYEEFLLTLPAEALRALAVAHYVTTTHLLYACGARGELPAGVGEYLTTVLFALPEGEALERFLAAAWFGYGYGATTKDGLRLQSEPAVLPEASAEARTLLQFLMMDVGYPAERADAILERVCRITDESAITLPEAYVNAGAEREA